MKQPHLILIAGFAAAIVTTAPLRAELLFYAASTTPGTSNGVTISEFSSGGSISTLATFTAPSYVQGTDIISMAVDRTGNLYALDYSGHTIQKIAPNGTVALFSSGSPGTGYPGLMDGITLDAQGNLYGVNSSDQIIKFGSDGSSSIYAVIKPSGSVPGGPTHLTFDPSGNLYVAVRGDNEIDKIAPDGTVSTFVTAGLNAPDDIAIDAQGNLFVTDQGDGKIQEITPDGTVSTFATITNNHPTEISFGPDGNLYVADHNTSIFEITPNGTVSTFASGLMDPRAVVGAFAVPEPSTFLMVGTGLALVVSNAWRRRPRSIA